MYFNFYYLFLFLRKYIKQKNMRLLLTFIIFILGGFYTFGKESCCEQCCECLGNCCKKGKEEVKNGNNVEEKKEVEEDGVQEEFYLKKTEAANPEEIKKLVNLDWYVAKKETASFILYEKINNIGNGGLNDNDVIKVTKDKNGFSIDKDFITEENNTKKWALFKIIYKEGKEKETKYLYCSDIEGGEFDGIFESCKQHISISVIVCDTSEVTDMSGMFYGCSSLTKLDLFNFNTEEVTSMFSMFSNCYSLQELNLSNFNTKKVTDMSSMFSDCNSLMKLKLSNFNTEKVTSMSSMFNNCSSLQELNLSNFNTEKVTSMSSMFSNCSSLQELNLSNFNTKKVTSTDDIFHNIPNENLKSFTLPESLSKLINNK